MSRIRKCERCKEREAVYALQYIASDKPSLYFLGEHIRGFGLVRVCPECGEKAEKKYEEERHGVLSSGYVGGCAH